MKTELTKEVLYDLFINKGFTYEEIANLTGWSKSTINITLKKFGIRKFAPRVSDLTNKEFGKLKVIGKCNNYKNHHSVWLCKCECGKEVEVLAGNLIRHNSKSCGCVKHNSQEKSGTWKGCGKLSGRYWAILKSNAFKRNIDFDITIDYAWNLFLEQKEKCALSRIDLGLDYHKNNHTASLDRIDSNKGYIEGNVQWVHKDVNLMKNTLEQNYFLEMCNKISKHRGTHIE